MDDDLVKRKVVFFLLRTNDLVKTNRDTIFFFFSFSFLKERTYFFLFFLEDHNPQSDRIMV